MTNCSEVCGYASAVVAQPTGQEESSVQVLALKPAVTCPRRTVSPSWVSVSTLDLPPTKREKGHFPLRFQEQRALLVWIFLDFIVPRAVQRGARDAQSCRRKKTHLLKCYLWLKGGGQNHFLKTYIKQMCLYYRV